jgi:hypothetical protein
LGDGGVGIYLRVSTGDQTVENQRQALIEAVTHRGWRVVEEFVDNGVSGAKGRDKRPAFAVDTTTPAGRALGGLCFKCSGYSPNSNARLFKSALKQALPGRARKPPRAANQSAGGGGVDPKIEDATSASLVNGKGSLKTARELKVGSSTVQRVWAAIIKV